MFRNILLNIIQIIGQIFHLFNVVFSAANMLSSTMLQSACRGVARSSIYSLITPVQFSIFNFQFSIVHC